MNSAHQTARLLAIAFQRSHQNRGRISKLDMRKASQRARVKAHFVVEVIDHMAEYGITMVELSTGGFGVLYSESLAGAKSVNVKQLLQVDELTGQHDAELEEELNYERPEFEDEE